MYKGKKKIAAACSFIMGAFMLAVGGMAKAQEADSGLQGPFTEKCGVIETRGQLYECTDFTSEEESDYQARIWDTAVKDKEVYEAVAKEYLAILDQDDCHDHYAAGADISETMFYTDESAIKEPLSGELLEKARIYFSKGKTCLAETAEIYGKHESLKEIADNYHDLSNKMGQISDRLPIPKPQS